MTDTEQFLEEAARLAGTTVGQVLSRVLHVNDGAISDLTGAMDEETAALTLRLDRAVRLRNPGLHYVMRAKFVGYRREGATQSAVGKRSQIFLSIVRNNARLEVLLPVSPDDFAGMPNAVDLRGKGRHGVGDLRVSLATEADVDRFVDDFAEWLGPQ